MNADNSADVLSWAALFYLLSVEDQLAYGSEASPIVENFHVGPEHAANDTTTSTDSGGDGGD